MSLVGPAGAVQGGGLAFQVRTVGKLPGGAGAAYNPDAATASPCHRTSGHLAGAWQVPFTDAATASSALLEAGGGWPMSRDA